MDRYLSNYATDSIETELICKTGSELYAKSIIKNFICGITT